MSAWRRDVEDGMGHSGLAPTKAERRQEREERELKKVLAQRDRQVALSAFELGYICHEKGMNLQEATILFNKTWGGK